MLLSSPRPTVDELRHATGWKIEPQGACKGELCVPLPAGTTEGDRVDLERLAGALGMAVVHDEGAGLWAVGPETLGGHALATVTVPELELPDFDGRPFRLASLSGTKVVLVAWAPY
jgi:hypothetical protein